MTFNAAEEGWILDHFVAGLSFPTFGTLTLHLAEGGSTPGIETPIFPVGGGSKCQGYVPQTIPIGDWSYSIGGRVCNTNTITFPEATADWTITVAGWVLVDTPPHWVCGGPTTEIKYIKKGETVVFLPGELCIHQNGDEPIYVGGFTNFAEDKIMEHIFGKVVYPARNVWLGLLDHDPGEVGTYLNNEVAQQVGGEDTGYGRIYVAPASWYHPYAPEQPQYVANLHNITFPEAKLPWGTVRYFALFDSPVYGIGEILIYGQLGLTLEDWDEWFYYGGPAPIPVEYQVNAGHRAIIDANMLGIWFSW